MDVSSIHVTFTRKEEWKLLTDVGFLQRIGQQFHWYNNDYRTFDDFLGELTSRKRKQIRKERRSILDKNLTIKTLSGAEIEERHWDAFYKFYLSTTDKKMGLKLSDAQFLYFVG